MVSGSQTLGPVQEHRNYRLVGEFFGSFVSSLETLTHSAGLLHPPFYLETQNEESFNIRMKLFVGDQWSRASSATVCPPFVRVVLSTSETPRVCLQDD